MQPIPILLYHSVSDEPSSWISRLTVRPRAFARHLDAVRAAGRTPLTISHLCEGLAGRLPLPDRPVAITFDDGFADTMTVAAPLLAERRMVATVYLTTATIGGTSPGGDRMLDWSQVGDLTALGHEVGGHSHRHPELDMVSADVARREVWQCKQTLEERLGHAVPSFAYPFGYSSPAVRSMVRDAGYWSACSVKNAISSGDDPSYQIPRLTVGAATSDARIARWLGGEGAPVGRRGERSVSRAWQVWRWTRSRWREPQTWHEA
jgi:peptidoglycan/xylan/chitin deacetylase (PgdA/CDA1 family)